jgi:septum formation inhibitor MinC
MDRLEFEGFSSDSQSIGQDVDALVGKIEEAFKVFKLCELNLNVAGGDYGELKIARLRLDFARHELVTLLKEAEEKGIKWGMDEFVKGLIQEDSNNSFRDIKESTMEDNKA